MDFKERIMWTFDPFLLDGVNQCLWRCDNRIAVKPKPYAVLEYLVTHAGRLVTQDELLSAVWPDTFVQPEVLRQYILELRRALGDRAQAPRYIRTAPKRGYAFIAHVIEELAASVDDLGPGAAPAVRIFCEALEALTAAAELALSRLHRLDGRDSDSRRSSPSGTLPTAHPQDRMSQTRTTSVRESR